MVHKIIVSVTTLLVSNNKLIINLITIRIHIERRSMSKEKSLNSGIAEEGLYKNKEGR